MHKGESGGDAVRESANVVAESLSADVLVLNGDIERDAADKLIELAGKRKRRPNVVLALVTPGGDADAAYRIARCLQERYEKFFILVSGYCKSAGTLCVLGANEIIMSDCGELGPLDVQFYKKDELGELSSGLVFPEALESLKEKAFEMFEAYMLDIKKRSQNLVTFKTATDVAAKMAVGLYEPIYRQLDPMQIGELARSMSVARAYGERLLIESQNYGSETLDILIGSYPSHGFVIDRRETAYLFDHVRAPSDAESALIDALGLTGKVPVPSDDGFALEYLSDEVTEAQNEKVGDGAGESEASFQRAGGESSATDPGNPTNQTGQATQGQDGTGLKLVSDK